MSSVELNYFVSYEEDFCTTLMIFHPVDRMADLKLLKTCEVQGFISLDPSKGNLVSPFVCIY